MNIRKAVIPAAGLGTRLLSATKEQPKEMLPVFSKGDNNVLGVKPLMQLIFEQLYDSGFREFCFVVGRGKRTIEDHFTPDHAYVEGLKKLGKDKQSEDLVTLYDKIESSSILWVNQSSPKGFGDAVKSAKSFCNEPFIVHAGDTCILSKDNDHIRRLVSSYKNCAISIIVKEVKDPRIYGVANIESGQKGALLVADVEEKPEKPKSNFAIMPVYLFNETIFENLGSIGKGKGGEYQLTDAIQKAISKGQRVIAEPLRKDEIMLDIGTPETYWEALKTMYLLSTK